MDLLDIIVLVAVLAATVAYFTKGSLWGVDSEAYPGAGAASKLGGGSAGTSSRDIVAKMEKNDKNVVVFYGSQTGTAEDYAGRIAKEAASRFGLKTMTADLDDYDFENLDTFPEDKVAVFVMATYGEGEPTDNAVEFYNLISDENAEFSKEESIEESPLRNLHYVIFGLGNSTYEKYNEMGRSVDRLLGKLGANRIGDYGEGDDGAGSMDEDYLAWKEDMFIAWQQAKGLEEREQVYEPSLEITEIGDNEIDANEVYLGETKGAIGGNIKPPFSQHNPYLARVVETQELFENTDRSCIHMEVDISGSNLKYMTGDHLALHAQNSNEEVDRFLSVFGLTAKRNTVIDVKALDATVKVPFPTPTTYDTVARFFLEINGPVSRQVVSSIAPFAPTEAARVKAKQLGADKDLFASTVTHHYLNLARLLKVISEGQAWTGVPFSFLVESLPHLSPRYYSISSSSGESREKITVTAAVERITPKGSDHVLKGVATNYIADIRRFRDGDAKALDYEIRGPRGSCFKDNGILVPVHVRHSNFKLPSSPQKPIIMVGPGTGVAPFRGFVHERAHQAKTKNTRVGRALLFFGCRKSTEDFLYRNEWAQFSQDGKPDDNGNYGADDFLHLVTAFSREQSDKVYVQHRMLEHAKEINDLLLKGANFYVCGDASQMARDVQRTLAKIVSQERGIPQEKAEALVKQMKAKNQYQEDVW